MGEIDSYSTDRPNALWVDLGPYLPSPECQAPLPSASEPNFETTATEVVETIQKEEQQWQQ